MRCVWDSVGGQHWHCTENTVWLITHSLELGFIYDVMGSPCGMPSNLGLVVQKPSVSVPVWFDTDAELVEKSCVSGYPDGSIGEEWATAGLGMG